MSDKSEWWPLKAVVQSSSCPPHTQDKPFTVTNQEKQQWSVSALKKDFMDKVIQNKHILKMNVRVDAAVN